MPVPQVIYTNLVEAHADELKAELNDYLQQKDPHNPFIEINHGSCYNQKVADLISETILKAELSWEDFLPALNPNLQHVLPIFNRFISVLAVVWLCTKTSYN